MPWAGQAPKTWDMLSLQAPNLSPNEQIFVQELQSKVPPNPSVLPLGNITFDEWLQLFKKWRETTSTSPSGAHLGIYKAIIAVMELT